MRLLIPLYAERTGERHGRAYRVGPLFRGELTAESDVRFDIALRRLRERVWDRLDRLGREGRHDALARWGFNPGLKCRELDFCVDLRKHFARGRFMVTEFESCGARLAFFPRFRDLWFVLAPGERLEERAQQALEHYFKERIRADRSEEEGLVEIMEASRSSKAWISMLAMDIRPAQAIGKPGPALLQLGGGEAMDGERELRKVGVSLDGLYPDELDRALFREEEVRDIAAALADPGRPAVAVLGRRGAGKTALIHECVFADMRSRPEGRAWDRRFWLLSPQRLVSGMIYVGQWERRLLAILEHAGKSSLDRLDTVLYFDDVLGLYLAGMTSGSRLCAADVLKPFVEARRVRVLAEMTPEVFRALRERDRGFADLFHVVQVRPTAERETWRILGKLAAQVEDRFGARFDPAAVPAVVDLQRRYYGEVAMPGAAAVFIKRLAAKRPGQEVGRKEVLEDFAASSGLQPGFADERSKLARTDVVAALKSLVVGQDEAVEALADAVCVAKAGLNDPGRPLAAYLFLGPTGVGKTQCAKALAAYLFGDEGRLLRFDMNECSTPSAAAALVGTPANPEGTLTSRVRRQPFCVLLLDEVEKAHPDVLDLLLQVLGEGRLTDALGRTTDFTKALIVLTSNLGVREAASRTGFTAGEPAGRGGFLRAAEDFFRPEFFNRLDRIVPFRALDRGEAKRIARLVIGEIFAREGLARRNCLLQVEPGALDRVVEEGFDPRYGARALKRAMDRLLTQPAGACLAALKPGSPALIRLFPARGGMHVEVEALVEARPRARAVAALDLGRPKALCERALEVVERLKADVDSLAPQRDLVPEDYPYLAARERLAGIKDALLDCHDMLSRRKPVSMSGHAPRHRGRIPPQQRKWRGSRVLIARRPAWSELFTADGHGVDLERTAGAGAPDEPVPDPRLRALFRELALLHLTVSRRAFRVPERVLLCIKAIGEGEAPGRQLMDYRELFGELLDLVVAEPVSGFSHPMGPAESYLVVEGPNALEFARCEEGTHLFTGTIGHITALCVRAVPLAAGEEPGPAIRGLQDQRAAWLERLAREGPAAPDPHPAGPVVRVCQAGGMTLDLRSGLMVRGTPAASDLRVFLLESLPLPEGLDAAGDR